MLNKKMTKPAITVLMPVYRQASYISRAVKSLLAQTLQEWELIIIDDGSPDEVALTIKPFLSDSRIRYFCFKENEGLGRALNYGLDKANASLIAYLPADDVYYPEHLASLKMALEREQDAVLAYSGIVHHYNKTAEGKIDGYPLQLVQVMHRLTHDRWMERDELTTDDLERMFWSKLRDRGNFTATGQLSCLWTDHPQQRHKILRETFEGGINPYRSYYKVKKPLRFQSSVGNYIDEVAYYQCFRERPDTPFAKNGLKIVLVGELSYNPERILALEERGHKLYGLWTQDPISLNAVGPLPFGHVEDLPRDNWQKALGKIQPDIIYALLNWQTVPFAYQVLNENPGIPFVWHFKEGPFVCIEKGIWHKLVDLCTLSDGQIYSSSEMLDWFKLVLPQTKHAFSNTLILDGDLPKQEWFTENRSPLLSQATGEIHTVVPGRPIGLHPPAVAELAKQHIHLHFYGDFIQELWREWIPKVQQLAPGYLHLHANIDQRYWVKEFSQYDAGWLHFFKSKNQGDLLRANWDDLNYPSRIGALAAAGLPMLQYDNHDSIVAMDRLIRKYDLGLFFTNLEELGDQIHDKQQMNKLRENVYRQRNKFTFDHHADRLISFFRKVVAG